MRRNSFPFKQWHLLTTSMGKFTPIMCEEGLPGDTWRGTSSMFIRLLALNRPVLHPVYVHLASYAVPLRLIWDDSEDFFTGGPDGTSLPTFPTITPPNGGFGKHTFMDHIGVNPLSPNPTSALAARANSLIWNLYYRDQDLQTEAPISTASGNDTTTGYSLFNVCWPKDRINIARPWTQKGASVTIPLGSQAVVGTGMVLGLTNGTTNVGLCGANGDSLNSQNFQARFYGQSVGTSVSVSGTGVTGSYGVTTDPTKSGLKTVDAGNGIELDILRVGSALQRFRESRAMYGSRYDELLMQQYGIKPLDARLNQPEFIGGGRSVITFSEVLQTAGTTDGSAAGVGQLFGHGIGSIRGHKINYFCQEHMLILTYATIVPVPIYCDGTRRMHNKRLREDYYTPEFATVGMQPVEKQEVYALSSDPTGAFGFTDRYEEYRRPDNYITGDFRDLLAEYHLGRIFASEPSLNGNFVTCDPSLRIFQQSITDNVLLEVQNRYRLRRCVMKRAVNVLK